MWKAVAVAALVLAASGIAWGETTDTPRFKISDDGKVVLDQHTGLQWMRCAVGQNWTGNTCAGIANRYTWDQASNLELSHAGLDGWRLPTVDELQGLVEYRMFNPAIDPHAFPNTPMSNFWSSSEAAYDLFYAWTVNFANGFSNWRHKRQRFESRMVRDAG